MNLDVTWEAILKVNIHITQVHQLGLNPQNATMLPFAISRFSLLPQTELVYEMKCNIDGA